MQLVLQHTATHITCVATHCNARYRYWLRPLQLTATRCNSLQLAATRCNSLQLTATQAQLEHISISLNLHADILKLPNGYDTLLSGATGQSFITPSVRRRIALARVLAKGVLQLVCCGTC